MAENSSTRTYLGENITNYDRLVTKVNTISTEIEKKRSTYQNMKSKIDKLTNLNKKLADGYELSLRIVVDVSKLLENYTKMFNGLEKLISTLDADIGVQQTDLQYINKLTKDSIIKISADFNEKFPSIVTAFEKEGDRESLANAQKLKEIVNELPSNAANVLQSDKVKLNGGALRKRKSNRPK